ncbi:hypothetical protein [Paenibacillus sp. IHB B 3415]|uniref:hypothetical protein n=1 Tax=Paenibacillus sp. IHB B 3415 TaxID=867080 RepID=UPI00128AE60F|nr:hypothetical protein [Paenibacillus sp. IHB B 3415]
MSWEPVGFMVFSNLEAFAWCALCMSIFRFKTSDYAWQILVVVTLMNLQSFVLRNELSLSYLVPLINILFITFLFSTIVRVSLLGSLTIASAGLVVFGFIQTVLAIVLFGSINAVDASVANGYALQISTAVIGLPLSWFLYRYGYGFSYDFERFRLKYEKIMIILTISVFMTTVALVLYLNQILNVIIVLAISLLFFLKYAIAKEKDL